MSVLWNDLRFALRMFLRNPGTSAVAVLSLALAIGPNATLFSVMDRLILKPPPVKGLSQLFLLTVRTDAGRETPSYPDYLDYQAAAGAAADLIGYEGHGAILNANGQQDILLLHIVTENYFPVLGVKAAAGRTLLESDRQFQGEPPVMISYSLWQRKFGGNPAIVGQTVLLNNRGFFVAGVAPRGFRAPGLGPPVDLWLPIGAAQVWGGRGTRDAFLRRDFRGLSVWVRLHNESDRPHMEAVLSGVAARLARDYPATNKGKSALLGSAEEREQGGRVGAMILLSLVGLVLLIAAANVAGVLLARGESRAREFAVRLAMGSRRLRLVRLLLTESLVLSLIAAGAGLLLAFWLVRAAPGILPPLPMSVDFDIRLDGRVLLYTLLLSFVTAIACGLAPALRVSRPDLMTVLKGDSPRGAAHFWLRSGLLIGQIAFCQFLLVGAGLLTRSYFEIERIRPGFDPDRKLVLATVVNVKGSGIDYRQLTETLRALPGMGQVSYCKTLPLLLVGGGGTKKVSLPGKDDEINIGWNAVGPGYFSTLGSRIVRGREFQTREAADSVLVNELLARRLWGSADAAIGKFLRVDDKDLQVAGVVENGKYQLILEESRPYLFVPAPPKTGGGDGALLVEARGDPKAALATVRKALSDTAPDLTIVTLTTMQEHMRIAMVLPQMGAGGMGILALLGVFLAGVGLYGLMSYNVNRRMHEIGVRMALGARPADVLRLVLRQSTLLVGVGASIGLVVAFFAAQVVSSLLYRVSPADPVALLAAITAVAAVALLAAVIPARRALRFDPMAVLRNE
ncbi:MAG: ABC transporter permease [Acidobacteriia bacterium]|nr:ABC transporter permease [Terriglobia bacterium]